RADSRTATTFVWTWAATDRSSSSEWRHRSRWRRVHDAAGGRTLRAESGGDTSPRGVSGGSDARADADERWMARALEEARAAASAGEVPVGAVIVREGEELVATQNRMIRDRDATSHAELLALRAASQLLGDQRLAGCTL